MKCYVVKNKIRLGPYYSVEEARHAAKVAKFEEFEIERDGETSTTIVISEVTESGNIVIRMEKQEATNLIKKILDDFDKYGPEVEITIEGYVRKKSDLKNYIGILHKDDNSDYGISFPDFPGCVTAITDIGDAVSMASQALRFHIESEIKDNDRYYLPEPTPIENIIFSKHTDQTGLVAFIAVAIRKRMWVRGKDESSEGSGIEEEMDNFLENATEDDIKNIVKRCKNDPCNNIKTPTFKMSEENYRITNRDVINFVRKHMKDYQCKCGKRYWEYAGSETIKGKTCFLTKCVVCEAEIYLDLGLVGTERYKRG